MHGAGRPAALPWRNVRFGYFHRLADLDDRVMYVFSLRADPTAFALCLPEPLAK